ncbi:MAG TPA: TPM domain-containing protein [Candidatus Acidoferrales bacterium]|nr:TPM domain-containing protein [Candidatus Acidoferrales bacterium]
MSSTHSFAKTAARVLALSCVALIWVGARAEKIKDLKPQGYVNDFAGVLSASAKDKLTALCGEVDHSAGAQIAIVTVKSLEGESAEQYSFDLASQWGVGPKQSSRGVMILLAPNDHKDRIEVGYGLEGILPDGKVGGFEREAVPLLRQSDYDGAVLLMTQRVATVIAADKGVTLTSLNGVNPPSGESGGTPVAYTDLQWLLPVIVLIIVVVIIAGLFRRGGPSRGGRSGGGIPWWMWFVMGNMMSGGRGGSWGGGGSSWGGGFGGGGGGGGGFGGFGGGGFGGGGASGSW